MTLDHQTEVKHTLLAQTQLADLVAQHDTGNNGSTGRTKTTAQWDWVHNVHSGAGWEGAHTAAAQDVQRSTGNKVRIGG